MRVSYSLEECSRGAQLPYLGHLVRRCIYHRVCDTRSVRRQTCDYLPGPHSFPVH